MLPTLFIENRMVKKEWQTPFTWYLTTWNILFWRFLIEQKQYSCGTISVSGFGGKKNFIMISRKKNLAELFWKMLCNDLAIWRQLLSENLNFIVSPSPPPSNSRKINHRKKRISINNSPKRMKSPNYYRRSPKKSSTCHQCHHHSSIDDV